MREAPSLAVIRGLQDAGANVRAYDPAGMALARTLLDNVAFAKDAYTPDSVPGADKYFRALRHLSVGRGPGNAFNDMHRLGRSPKRVASPHIQGQGLALSALAPGRSSRRPPRGHSGARGPLMNNNEP